MRREQSEEGGCSVIVFVVPREGGRRLSEVESLVRSMMLDEAGGCSDARSSERQIAVCLV